MKAHNLAPVCICGHTCKTTFTCDIIKEKLTLFTLETVTALMEKKKKVINI